MNDVYSKIEICHTNWLVVVFFNCNRLLRILFINLSFWFIYVSDDDHCPINNITNSLHENKYCIYFLCYFYVVTQRNKTNNQVCVIIFLIWVNFTDIDIIVFYLIDFLKMVEFSWDDDIHRRKAGVIFFEIQPFNSFCVLWNLFLWCFIILLVTLKIRCEMENQMVRFLIIQHVNIALSIYFFAWKQYIVDYEWWMTTELLVNLF